MLFPRAKSLKPRAITTDYFPNHRLRPLVDGQEHAPEVLADEAEHDELRAREHEHRGHHPAPPVGRAAVDEPQPDDEDERDEPGKRGHDADGGRRAAGAGARNSATR